VLFCLLTQFFKSIYLIKKEEEKMKYCTKCDARRQEDHSFCYQCSTKLVERPRTNEEKIAMLKIILKETHYSIRECANTKKEHDAKSIESASECLDCLKTAFTSIKEISEIILLNGNEKRSFN